MKRRSHSVSRDRVRLQFALNNAQAGLWDWESESGLVYRSQKYLDMLGYESGELADSMLAWLDIVHPEDREVFKRAVDLHQSGAAINYEAEYRVRHRSGRWLWLLDRGTTLEKDDQGRPTRVLGWHSDITAQKELERELLAQTTLFREAQRLARLGSWVWDVGEDRIRWSSELLNIAGWPLDQMPPTLAQLSELLGESHDLLMFAVKRILLNRKPFALELEILRRSDGTRRQLLMRGEALPDERRIIRLAGVVQDITDQRLEQQARHRERKLLDHVSALGNIGGFEYSPETGAVFLTHQSYRILKVPMATSTDAHTIIALYERRSLPTLIRAIRNAIAIGGPFDLQLELVRVGGGRVWMRTRGEAELINGHCARLYGTLQDVTERHLAEQHIAELAHYDSLTGLPNRVLFADRAHVAIARTKRNGLVLALLFVDLDKFKYVNDNFGHAAGDQLLQEVARRLARTIRASDTVSRHGGDEFLVLLPELNESENAGTVAHKLIEALDQPIEILGGYATVSCSIGISLLSPQCADLEALMRNADTAMYIAKSKGRGCYKFFNEVD